TIGLVEFAKSVVKLLLLLGVLAAALLAMADTLSLSVHTPPRLLGRALEEPLGRLMTGTLIVAIAIGAADFLWQRHSHAARLRMTHEELKKETRESEGDPQTSARRRERAKEIAGNRMLDAVPEASVVITNPAHYAVALAWSREPDSAPRCVAKGIDEMAAAIRERAEGAGVPLRPDPPTARALYAATRIGQEIAPEHYRAVAAAILFADEIRAAQAADRAAGQGHRAP
ncbi:MAG: EscU/YscU/HrcU family type III secretion system export apparatus switch protein, partial [Pseudomonadota bacterium]